MEKLILKVVRLAEKYPTTTFVIFIILAALFFRLIDLVWAVDIIE